MVDSGSNIVESDGSVVDCVHGSDIGEQGLGSADITGGFFSSDMLLSGLETHSVANITLVILGDSDDTSWELSLVLISAGDEGSGWSSVAHGDSESLGTSDRDISTLFSRGLDFSQSEKIGGDDSANTVTVKSLVELGIISDNTSLVWGLDQDSRIFVIELGLRFISDNDLDSQESGSTLNYLDGGIKAIF